MELFFGILIGAALVFGAVWARMRFLGFAGQNPSDYAHEDREFDIRRHLDGPIDCEGVIFGPSGRVSSRFVAEFNATWNGNTGTMAEHFSYDSGMKQDREWRLTLLEDGNIRAEADDLVGAGKGKQSGSGVCTSPSLTKKMLAPVASAT